MQHARDRIHELTDRRRVLVPVEDIVQDVNRFLRGRAGYFRRGNSARHFVVMRTYATDRLALFVAKRHRRARSYGWRAVVYRSPDRYGPINLNGSVVAPRPNRPWREKPNADGERTSVSRVRENRMPGSMRRREETDTSRARTRRTVLAPPADTTLTVMQHRLRTSRCT